VFAFIVRRLLLSIPTLFGVLVVAFLLLNVAPGDPVEAMVGERADPETIARLRKELHLDEPLLKQFGLYAGGVLRGDFGNSYITQRPIIQDIRERFPKTLLLAGSAMLLASVLGITRSLSARHPGGWFIGSVWVSRIRNSFPVY
jgi:ABC-type dipeptide/oligopeptide/nickel transport system permease component